MASFGVAHSRDFRHQEFSTYEETRAQEWNSSQADKVHWEQDAAFRKQPYRYLHHQNGFIGTFQIRLLEAANLKRSYWSPLGLGPVKLLGLSKAHGPVSSFVSFSLDHRPGSDFDQQQSLDSKPAAKPLELPPAFVSPIMAQDDNPVWTNCFFDIKLRKGDFQDGQKICLSVRVDEDATAVENLLPGVPSGGDSRLLGTGSLDLTSLCLGQTAETGQPQVGVLDTWINISQQKGGDEIAKQEHKEYAQDLDKKDKATKDEKDGSADCVNATGRVRILVSYLPNGMEPKHNDIVALEAFARQNPRKSSCRPILPPLLPLQVVKTSGSWLLVDYELPGRSRRSSRDKRALLRLHRNSVFVIERKNIVDGTLNLALLPADVFMNSPLGGATREVLGPAFVAGKQLLMPALLSSKLLWMAVRTTAVASITGVQAATGAFVNEGSNSLTNDGEGSRTQRSNNYKFVSL
ncbi:unnamed protein product [Cylindrotheca closterium]|uniref:C2 domain-containing protein n=1 Tax=Cylindrotheca closterium TaxID=2856 RepID=A0AAD2PVT0_9STRA|nr:unnamed protein product [Cylindrotheca closterium]